MRANCLNVRRMEQAHAGVLPPANRVLCWPARYSRTEAPTPLIGQYEPKVQMVFPPAECYAGPRDILVRNSPAPLIGQCEPTESPNAPHTSKILCWPAGYSRTEVPHALNWSMREESPNAPPANRILCWPAGYSRTEAPHALDWPIRADCPKFLRPTEYYCGPRDSLVRQSPMSLIGQCECEPIVQTFLPLTEYCARPIVSCGSLPCF